MINKIANSIEMSFDIPESEKEIAKAANKTLEHLITSLFQAKEHLNIIYNPFKEANELPSEAVKKYRGAIRRFKEQIVTNYNKTKAIALKAIVKMNFFRNDTHISELIKALKDAVENLETEINKLCEDLDNVNEQDFKNKIIADIEAIQSETDDIEDLIKERIIKHIDTNILAKDWIANTSEQLKYKIQDRVPYITQLFHERQKALNS